MSYALTIARAIGSTLWDVLPIIVVVVFFQLVVLRRPFTNLPRLLMGTVCVVVGLAIFLVGLELALFPLGEVMARQLASAEFLTGSSGSLEQRADSGSATTVPTALSWYRYYWIYLFAFTIGVATAIAEPALIAVTSKASEVSGGTIQATQLRIIVAIGVGVGVAVGTLRIVLGYPLPYFILPGYVLVTLQTAFTPKSIIPIAYDSGGVTTSTVTVPIVAALGLGLATQIDGADPLIDGFGLMTIKRPR